MAWSSYQKVGVTLLIVTILVPIFIWLYGIGFFENIGGKDSGLIILTGGENVTRTIEGEGYWNITIWSSERDLKNVELRITFYGLTITNVDAVPIPDKNDDTRQDSRILEWYNMNEGSRIEVEVKLTNVLPKSNLCPFVEIFVGGYGKEYEYQCK